jgi:hypothetical protein
MNTSAIALIAVNGRPLNRQAMQARFDGAVRLQPTPPTPEHKLIERLNYQKRQAAKYEEVQRNDPHTKQKSSKN